MALSSAIFPMPMGINRPELRTNDLMSSSVPHQIDPFLVISLFDMRGPLFPPHPHAGFSVATYIFPESQIGFWNQDTLGNRNLIPPGAFHMTVAGKGVMHEETVTRSGLSALGLQIWIDHAAADRETAPRALHLPAPAVPTHSRDGVVQRVLLGTSEGLSSPLTAPLSARIVDVDMAHGASLDVPSHGDETSFAVIRFGQIETDAGRAGPASAIFAAGSMLKLRATAPSRLTVFAGPPLRHTAIPAGPFVASTAAQAQSFRARFASGDMGRLRPFDQDDLDRAFDREKAQNVARGLP